MLFNQGVCCFTPQFFLQFPPKHRLITVSNRLDFHVLFLFRDPKSIGGGYVSSPYKESGGGDRSYDDKYKQSGGADIKERRSNLLKILGIGSGFFVGYFFPVILLKTMTNRILILQFNFYFITIYNQIVIMRSFLHGVLDILIKKIKYLF